MEEPFFMCSAARDEFDELVFLEDRYGHKPQSRMPVLAHLSPHAVYPPLLPFSFYQPAVVEGKAFGERAGTEEGYALGWEKGSEVRRVW